LILFPYEHYEHKTIKWRLSQSAGPLPQIVSTIFDYL